MLVDLVEESGRGPPIVGLIEKRYFVLALVLVGVAEFFDLVHVVI